jgi:hypothetical protein
MPAWIDAPVFSEGEWHSAQPTWANNFAPLAADRLAGAGFAGAESRINIAKLSMSDVISDAAGIDSCRFLLSKAEPDPAAIEDVLVDRASEPFSVEDGLLKLEVQAEPGQVRNIEILERVPHHRTTGFGIVHSTGVLLRRGLSEFRDNTLARHSGLLKVARSVARKLKVTGDA